MSDTSITVLGGGVAGLSAALLLARSGSTVTVLERDRMDVGAPEEAPDWARKGIPHFLQPHAFIPRGRAELLERLPDVYDALIAAGAHDVDVRGKLPGPPRDQDQLLQYLAVRRPVIEWALRRAVVAEPCIEVRSGVRVDGIRVERGRVRAVRVGGSEVSADLVVDALGRRTPVWDWLAGAGVERPAAEVSECGVVYYSRYYRQRDGFDLPDGPWFLSPRGDLGYLGFATFPGDNRTFAALLAVPSGVSDWRGFASAATFEAAVAQIPALAQWVDPRGVDPITGVLPMAGLRNTLNPAFPPGAGIVAVGDAYCHTDPVLAHGLAFALIHANALVTALQEHAEPVDALAAYATATTQEVGERYRLATALDAQRHRMWLGQSVDFAHHDGDYALFSMVAAAAAAATDADIARVFSRRIGLLDSTAVLDSDAGIQTRIEAIFAAMLASPRVPPGPPKATMMAIAQPAASA